MRKVLLLLTLAAPIVLLAKGMTTDELGEVVCKAFAARDFEQLKPALLNADDVSHFLNLTTESDEYRQMTPEERYLVDAWLAEAKHTTYQEFEYKLYALQQEFEKILRKGADMYRIDWSGIKLADVSYSDEIDSGVQKIRPDLRITFVSGVERYQIQLTGATFIDGGWKAQVESLKLVKMK